MFGLSWTKHASVSRGGEWNPGYESFRVHTQKKGRNVHGKENLPPLKHGQGGGVALSLVHRLVFGRIGQVGKPMNTFTGCFGLGDERGSYVEYSQLIRTDLYSNEVEAQP